MSNVTVVNYRSEEVGPTCFSCPEPERAVLMVTTENYNPMVRKLGFTICGKHIYLKDKASKMKLLRQLLGVEDGAELTISVKTTTVVEKVIDLERI